MPQLGPFRDYSEHEVINVFAVSGYDGNTILNRGTLVKIAGEGFKLDGGTAIEFLGNPSAFSPTNVVSQRYGAIPKVVPCTSGTTDIPLGITLFDVRETDENGELLKFRPRKAAELEAVISGQAVPVVRRGLFAYSGITTGLSQTVATGVGTISAGTSLYPGANGALTTYFFTGASNPFPLNTKVGTTMGAVDSRGYTVVYLNVP
jgi:hypothetical protein